MLWSLGKVVLKEVGSFSCRIAFFIAKEAANIYISVIN
jgi:hypothetical protein